MFSKNSLELRFQFFWVGLVSGQAFSYYARLCLAKHFIFLLEKARACKFQPVQISTTHVQQNSISLLLSFSISWIQAIIYMKSCYCLSRWQQWQKLLPKFFLLNHRKLKIQKFCNNIQICYTVYAILIFHCRAARK